MENIHERSYLGGIYPDTIFSFKIVGEDVAGGLEYNARLYEKKTMERLAVNFMNTLREVFSDINSKINSLDVISNLAARWFAAFPHIKMVNAYGTTEASDDITHFIMTEMIDRERIPIGKPIQNLYIYIVDGNLKPCPIGVKGEICVSGVGVGRGYLNNPGLTAERFKRTVISHSSLVIGKTKRAVISHSSLVISSPKKLSKFTNDQCPMTNDRPQKFLPNDQCIMTNDGSSRLYRTGDLARWLPDGNIEFLGRIDHQVKIRGFRIGLGEIESHLLKHDGIKEAVVVAEEEETRGKHLYAYIVPDKKPGISGLRKYLSKVMPDYMIPLLMFLRNPTIKGLADCIEEVKKDKAFIDLFEVQEKLNKKYNRGDTFKNQIRENNR